MNVKNHIEEFSKILAQKGYTEEFILDKTPVDDLIPVLENYLSAQTSANKNVLPAELIFVMGTPIDGPFIHQKNTVAQFEVHYKKNLGFTIQSMEIRRVNFLLGKTLACKHLIVNSPNDILTIEQANALFSMNQIKAFANQLAKKGYDMPYFSQRRKNIDPIDLCDLESCLLKSRKGQHNAVKDSVTIPDKFSYAIYSDVIPDKLHGVCVFNISYRQDSGIRINEMELIRLNGKNKLESLGRLKIDDQDAIPSKKAFKNLQPHELIKRSKTKGKKL